MDNDKAKGVIEAILFATGRVVKMNEFIRILELTPKEIKDLIEEIKEDYSKSSRGLDIVTVDDGFQLASKKDYYEYLYPAFDKRIQPKLSQASLEVLAIIAYNPRATRIDVDTIRGVDSTASLYRLQEYNLIEQAGKADLPGKPMTYKVTDEFLKMFGLDSLKDLPDLPKYKLDSNRQVVIDEIIEEKKDTEAPMPQGEDVLNEEIIDSETIKKAEKNIDSELEENKEEIEENNLEENDEIEENNIDKKD